MWKTKSERRQSWLQVRRDKPTSFDEIDNNLVSAQIDFEMETKTPLFIWGGYGRGDPKPVLERFYSSPIPSEKVQLERFLKNFVYKIKEAIEKPGRTGREKERQGVPREFYSIGSRDIVIPGSSIKGSVRSRLENLFKAQGDSVGCCYCVPRRSRTPPSQYFRSLYSPSQRSKCEPTEDKTNVCVVCNIFGALGLASHVQFSDAIPEGKPDMEVLTVRPSTRRSFQIPIKAVAPRSRFKISMHCQNLKTEEIGLIFMAMRLHESKPILMGAYKYVSKQTNRGIRKFGEVVIKPLSVQVFKVERGLVIPEERHTAGFVSECLESARKSFGNDLRTLDEVAMKQ